MAEYEDDYETYEDDGDNRGIRSAAKTKLEAKSQALDKNQVRSDIWSAILEKERTKGPVKPSDSDSIESGLTPQERKRLSSEGQDTNVKKLRDIISDARVDELLKSASPKAKARYGIVTADLRSDVQGGSRDDSGALPRIQEKKAAEVEGRLDARAAARLKQQDKKTPPLKLGAPIKTKPGDSFSDRGLGVDDSTISEGAYIDKFGDDPTDVVQEAEPEQLQKAAGSEDAAKAKVKAGADADEFSLMEKIALAGMAILPTLVGYALAGEEGAYRGAAATGEGAKVYGDIKAKQESEDKKIAGELAKVKAKEGILGDLPTATPMTDDEIDQLVSDPSFAGTVMESKLIRKLLSDMDFRPREGENEKISIERGKAARQLFSDFVKAMMTTEKLDSNLIGKVVDNSFKAEDRNLTGAQKKELETMKNQWKVELETKQALWRKELEAQKIGGKLAVKTTPAAPSANKPLSGTPERTAQVEKLLPVGYGLIEGKDILTKDTTKLKASLAQYDVVASAMKKLENLLEAGGPQPSFLGSGVEMSTLVTQITLGAKEIENLGVLNGPDERILTRMLGDPTSFWSNVQSWVPATRDNALIKLRSAKEHIKDRKWSDLSTQNIYEYRTSPKGTRFKKQYDGTYVEMK